MAGYVIVEQCLEDGDGSQPFDDAQSQRHGAKIMAVLTLSVKPRPQGTYQMVLVLLFVVVFSVLSFYFQDITQKQKCNNLN